MSHVVGILVLLALATGCGQRLGARAADPSAPPEPSPPAASVPEPSASPAETPPIEEPAPERPAAPRPYRGLGAWVDVFDRAAWRNPGRVVARLGARGVRTLFLQTQSYRFPGPFRFPDAVGPFLEAAHARGMAVVAWYVPGFDDLSRDLGRAAAALDFETPAGDRFDGVALDIEVTVVTDPLVRAERLVRLSEAIRARAGPGTPLGAILPSPLRSPSYWPVLPVADLARLYDVLLPMAYWTGHASGAAGSYDYLTTSLRLLRAEAGPEASIHLIGGLAGDASRDEIAGFVRAARGGGVLGASLYDAGTTTPSAWRLLRNV